MHSNTSRRTAEALIVVFSLLIVLVGMAMIATSAAAAETPNGTDSQSQSSQSVERIDQSADLLASSFDESNGTARITLRSDVPQTIVVSDAGGFREGGQIEQREVFLLPNETATVEIPVTVAQDGFVGVSIATQDTLYAEPLVQPANTSDANPYQRTSAEAGWIGGAAAAAVGTVLGGLYVVRKQPEQPEELDI